MKKLLLVVAVFCMARANAQIVNAGFEHFQLDTSYFAGFAGGIVAGNTFPYYDPVGWTSSNGITGANSLGALILVTQTSNHHSGDSAIQLVTDTLKTLSIGGQTVKLVVPGMALNGTFNASSIISQTTLISGGSITPASVPGAGQPFTQRLADFTGYYKYAPVYDSFTNSLDTCVLWATLRKGSTIVANAVFKTSASTVGVYAPFSANFVYLNCETPDTLVILLASSLPKFAGLLSGNTGLTPGSVLLVDDLSYDTLPASSTLVFAVNDIDTAYKNKIDTINVLGNDASCSMLPLTVSTTTGPVNGTARVWNNEIIYTPNQDFLGADSIFYTDTDSNNVTSSAWVKLYTTFSTGISEANEVAMNMYPVPASNHLHIQFDNKGRTTARVYDMIGNLVLFNTLTQNDNSINVATLTNGMYVIQLVNESNTIIARGKFAVSR